MEPTGPMLTLRVYHHARDKSVELDIPPDGTPKEIIDGLLQDGFLEAPTTGNYGLGRRREGDELILDVSLTEQGVRTNDELQVLYIGVGALDNAPS